MSVRISTEWSYNGISTVILENGLLRVIVMPGLGAKIWQLTYLPSGRDLLWQHPRIRPRPLPFHAIYDDVVFGGWRNLHVAILESCTGYPISVAAGVAQGTHQVLPAGAAISCDITAVVYAGISGVKHIDADGSVTAADDEDDA
jgi:hypothetical protein